VEGDLPVRFVRVNNAFPARPIDSTTVGFVLHLGLAF
jgi:hypothetical protein